jgi:hypothetical protein
MFKPLLHVLLFVLCALLLGGCANLTTKTATPTGDLWVENFIDEGGATGLKGMVSFKDGGQPISGAYVNVYPDGMSNLLGPSQFISAATTDDGRYNLSLPPGTYFVVARKRTSGSPTGPLSPGDFFSEHQRIMTRVINGKMSLVDLRLAPMKAPMFFKKVSEVSSNTGVRGVLTDAKGVPISGGFAMAYTDAEMKRLPDYASSLSDSQGRFTIYLPAGGSYYLAGRIHAWDMPQQGEPFGKLDEPLAIKDGQFIENVRIELEPFSGTYLQGKSRRPF